MLVMEVIRTPSKMHLDTINPNLSNSSSSSIIRDGKLKVTLIVIFQMVSLRMKTKELSSNSQWYLSRISDPKICLSYLECLHL